MQIFSLDLGQFEFDSLLKHTHTHSHKSDVISFLVFVFILETSTWEQVQWFGERFGPVARHTAVAVNDTRILFLGDNSADIYALDIINV